MDLIDRLRDLAARKAKQIEHLQTEEATKTALVLPFINTLGYNVFDPTQVVPEFTSDVGTKKGEKVDYAIMRDAKPIILIECKVLNADLDKEHTSQLYRYFSVTDARFGILTDGIIYRFYSDLEEPNKMDSKPFLEFNLLGFDEKVVEELKKFTAEGFDLENILSTASDLKYTKGIKRVLTEEWVNPSEKLVKLFARRVYSGMMTQSVREQFTAITKQALHEFVSERVNERLKSALEGPKEDIEGKQEGEEETEPVESKIVTTEEEMEGYYIVKAIVSEIADSRRVFMRDTINYCGVLLDDTNRKPICRLHFNNSAKKLVGTFDGKKETRTPIAEVAELFNFAGEIKRAVLAYDGKLEPEESETGSGHSGA